MTQIVITKELIEELGKGKKYKKGTWGYTLSKALDKTFDDLLKELKLQRKSK